MWNIILYYTTSNFNANVCDFSSVGELNHQFDHMTEDQKEDFLRFFILPFLSRNTSGQI